MKNPKKEAPMKLSDLQRPSNKWEDLEAGYQEALSLFEPLYIYSDQAKAIEPLANEEEIKQLRHILNNITNDAKVFKAELDGIRNSHCINGVPRTGPVNDRDILDSDDLFIFIQIAAAYRSFGERFTTLITQPGVDFDNIIDQIRVRNKQVQVQETDNV